MTNLIFALLAAAAFAGHSPSPRKSLPPAKTEFFSIAVHKEGGIFEYGLRREGDRAFLMYKAPLMEDESRPVARTYFDGVVQKRVLPELTALARRKEPRLEKCSPSARIRWSLEGMPGRDGDTWSCLNQPDGAAMDALAKKFAADLLSAPRSRK